MTSPVPEVDENDAGARSAEDHAAGGYTLPGKPANVTLGRKESLTKKVNAPDNLEGTKDFVSNSRLIYHIGG